MVQKGFMMIITVIHGSPRPKGCSSSIARMITERFKDAQVLEINLQKENLPYCLGCMTCVKKGIEFCKHSNQTLEMKEKILKADLIIVAAPVYILHMSGQLKTFIDHFPSMFMIHRPESAMFNKQLIVVASAAGAVYKTTIKELKECFNFFGISKIYGLGIAVKSYTWEDVSDDVKTLVNSQIDKVVKKVKSNKNKKKLSFTVRKWFYIARMIQRKVPVSEVDTTYWESKGWLKKNKPWN